MIDAKVADMLKIPSWVRNRHPSKTYRLTLNFNPDGTLGQWILSYTYPSPRGLEVVCKSYRKIPLPAWIEKAVPFMDAAGHGFEVDVGGVCALLDSDEPQGRRRYYFQGK